MKIITVAELQEFHELHPDYDLGESDSNGYVIVEWEGEEVYAPLTEWVNDPEYFEDADPDYDPDYCETCGYHYGEGCF